MGAIERLLEGDMAHRAVGGGAVPVALARRDPDRVAGLDLDDLLALGLVAPDAGDHIERLAERMRVPVRAPSRKEGDTQRTDPGGIGRGDDRVLVDGAGEILGRPVFGWSLACFEVLHSGPFPCLSWLILSAPPAWPGKASPVDQRMQGLRSPDVGAGAVGGLYM